MKNVPRLLEQFTPKHYDLFLAPDREASVFNGKVVVTADIPKPTTAVKLHAKGLNIKAAIINGQPVGSSLAEKNDELTLTAKEKLRGKAIIEIEFAGKITEHMHGIYPCNFELNGKKKQLLATQFESHHAREVFPCIDEPAAKATFDLTLTTPVGETVLANTPPRSQKKIGDSVVTSFETTPIMSTYLLAFVYGEMRSKEKKAKSGVLVRAWAIPDKVSQVDFALDCAVKILEHFEDYFRIPFPLPRCDFVALPDFASGAMENWGLITFREVALLVDEKNTSLDTKQEVVRVIGHELAHQWFGNLVTMEWWDDLWLNEGFASWIEAFAVDLLFPEWRPWENFVSTRYMSALSLDALEHTHPVQVPVPDPEEIRTIFDSISYNKGSSVIRMLHAYLGPEDFQKGLTHYLKQHSYKNTTTNDLWSALEQTSGKPVRKFMSVWTEQPGFPVVTVAPRQEQIELEQTRYFINPRVQKKKRDATVWPVPLRVNGDDILFDKKKGALSKPDSLTALNTGATGLYLLNFGDTLDGLAVRLPENQLERWTLLHNSFQLAKGSFLSTDKALDLLSRYSQEDNLIVWELISSQIGHMVRVFEDKEIRRAFRKLSVRLARKQLDRLGWDPKKDEDHFDQLLRPLILGLAAFGREETVIADGLRRFEAAKSPSDIDADLRSVVFSIAARHGEESSAYRKLLGWYRSARSAEDREILGGALTDFKQPELVEKSLALITTKDVRLQDIGQWVSGSFANRHAKQATWLWLKKNWSWVEDKLGQDMMMSYFPIFVGRTFATQEMLKEYDAFFSKRKTPGLARGIAQGRETLEWQMLWRERDIESVQRWLGLSPLY